MKETENTRHDMENWKILERVMAEMTQSDDLFRMAEVFKCMADPSRLKIINALLLSEMCVQILSQAVAMSQPAVSHHLKQLRQIRLVKTRREGKTVYYTLSDYHIPLLFELCKTHLKEPEEI